MADIADYTDPANGMWAIMLGILMGEFQAGCAISVYNAEDGGWGNYS